MNELSVMKQTQANMMLFDESTFGQLERVAGLMVTGSVMVPDHLRKSKGDCFAVAMQAAQWGMNPFAVAQKTFLVSGTLGYEAQLVNAVISTSTAITGRFHYKYGGDWSKIEGVPGKKKQVPDKYKQGQMKWITEKGWADKDEVGVFIQVGALISGEEEITWGEPVYMASQEVRNSPLWVTDPKQQLAYLGVKKWARIYTPGVILGVYTPDEIEARDITPVAFEDLDKDEKLEAHKKTVAKKKTPAKKKAPIEGESKEVESEPLMTLEQFKLAISNASTPKEMSDITAKATHFIGADKAKASKCYKDRVAAIKKAQEPAKQEPEVPRPIDSVYKLLDMAKTEEDLGMIADTVMDLSSEDKANGEELELFNKAYQAKRDEVVKVV